MRRIIWSDPALDDLERIETYIGQFDGIAAARLKGKLVRSTKSLLDFPNIGRRVGRNTRQLALVWPYLIRYRLHADTVEILSIRHGARSTRSR